MKALIVLIVLLALPFSVQAESDLDASSTGLRMLTDSIVSDTMPTFRGRGIVVDTSGITISTPTFEVYYIDTVGWRLTFDNRTVTLLEDEGAVPVVDSLWCRLFGEPLLEPVTKTVIVARFRTDAELMKIRKWRVREK